MSGSKYTASTVHYSLFGKEVLMKHPLLTWLSFAVALPLLLSIERASAEVITFDLLSPNTAINAYPSPFATVRIDRTDVTHATVTFQSYIMGGYQYLMGDGSTVALNVNASTFTVGPVAESNSLGSPFTPTWIATTNAPGQQVDGWGKFNLTVNNFDGFTHSATNVQFTLTNTSGSWFDALSVLLANGGGSSAAAHIFVCPAGSCDGALTSGHASNLATVPAPETLILFGTRLIGLAGPLWRGRKQGEK